MRGNPKLCLAALVFIAGISLGGWFLAPDVYPELIDRWRWPLQAAMTVVTIVMVILSAELSAESVKKDDDSLQLCLGLGGISAIVCGAAWFLFGLQFGVAAGLWVCSVISIEAGYLAGDAFPSKAASAGHIRQTIRDL